MNVNKRWSYLILLRKSEKALLTKQNLIWSDSDNCEKFHLFFQTFLKVWVRRSTATTTTSTSSRYSSQNWKNTEYRILIRIISSMDLVFLLQTLKKWLQLLIMSILNQRNILPPLTCLPPSWWTCPTYCWRETVTSDLGRHSWKPTRG